MCHLLRFVCVCILLTGIASLTAKEPVPASAFVMWPEQDAQIAPGSDIVYEIAAFNGTKGFVLLRVVTFDMSKEPPQEVHYDDWYVGPGASSIEFNAGKLPGPTNYKVVAWIEEVGMEEASTRRFKVK